VMQESGKQIRSEQRLVRPFIGVDAFEGLLQGVKVTVNGHSIRSDHESLDESLFSDLNIHFDLSVDPKDFELPAADADVPLNELDFIVVAYGSTFKHSIVLRRWKLASDEIDEGFSFHSSDLPEIISDNFGGFSFVLAVVLAESRSPKPLRVYEAGTWLARREIAFKVQRDSSLFAPTPMDSAKKTDLGVPQKTLLYIQEGSESIHLATRVEDVLTVWVDNEILISLQNNSNPTSDVVQMLLARTAIGAVVELAGRLFESKDFDMQALADTLQGSNDDQDSVLNKFVRKAHKVLGNKQDYLKTIKELRADPQQVAAKMEASADLLGEIRRALVKEDS
jgi:hypothetical protein